MKKDENNSRSITLGELPQIARDILTIARERQNDKGCIIALSGDLGAGKTTLTQEIAKALAIKEKVISPTFVIMKKYKIIDEKWDQFIHIDAYRLEKSGELLNLGWQELANDKKNLIVIEWPEKVPDCIPKEAIRLELLHEENDKRTLRVNA